MESVPSIINRLALVFLIACFAPFFAWIYPRLVEIVDAGEITAVVELPEEEPLVIDGIHVESGLIYDDGYDLVIKNCAGCHSLALVTQNAATHDGWKDVIRWMQKTQGLWELGEAEDPILDYLSKNYAPKEFGRRPNLVIKEWYDL
ncbi:MAG: hypothetical protein ACI865_001802 [Flavobacteriaceae bacterium]|jgi:hypothetical protein